MADEPTQTDLSSFPRSLLSQRTQDLVTAGGVTCPFCKTFLAGQTLGEIQTAVALHGEAAEDGVCPARRG
jgi:hypothetical protein